MCRFAYARTARGGGNLKLAPQGFQDVCHSEGVYPKESSLLLIPKAGLLRHKPRNDKFGFTLAEVLITLGIIGIVAAMTIPTLLANHRSKVLEATFQKSYNEFSQVLLRVTNVQDENIYGNLIGSEIQYLLANEYPNSKVTGEIYPTSPEFQEKMLGFSLPIYKTYNKSKEFTAKYFDDGSVIVNKGFFIFINSDNRNSKNIQFALDINGIKAPNIVGYDVFFFGLNENNYLILPNDDPSLCSLTSNDEKNGYSCSYYAINDKKYFGKLAW